MNETDEPVEQSPSKEPEQSTWQAPAHEVIDTALEVTAYSLNSR